MTPKISDCAFVAIQRNLFAVTPEKLVEIVSAYGIPVTKMVLSQIISNEVAEGNLSIVFLNPVTNRYEMLNEKSIEMLAKTVDTESFRHLYTILKKKAARKAREAAEFQRLDKILKDPFNPEVSTTSDLTTPSYSSNVSNAVPKRKSWIYRIFHRH